MLRTIHRRLLSTLFTVPFLYQTSSGQLFSGHVIDSESHEKIPFVNMGILGKSLGTVSNINGTFELTIDPKFDRDSLRVFMIGYRPLTFCVADFKKTFNNKPVEINLERLAVNLEEVVVYSKKTETKIAGRRFNNKNVILGLATDKKGCEIAAQIRIKKRTTYLKELNIHVADNPFDSVLLRVNLYDSKNNLPDVNILSKPIYVTAKIKRGIISVDLTPYQLVVKDHFFAAVQWISESRDKVLSFCAGMGGRAYVRSSSEDTWESNQPFGLGINCKISYEVN